MSRSSSEYIASKEEGDTVGLLSSETHLSSDVDSSYSTSSDIARGVLETAKRRRFARIWWFAVVLTTVLVSNATTFYVTRSLSFQNSEQAVTFPPKGIAPFLRGLNRKMSTKTFDATFYDSKDSIYRKHGSMETELAWKDLTPSGIFLVDREDGAASDLDPARNAYYNNASANLVGYPVALETFHQVHCLNMIRQNLYYNLDFTRKHYMTLYGIDRPDDFYIVTHLDHCVDFLRQRLMCTADIGLVPMIWQGHRGRTVGDLERDHTCRDYEAVRQYAVEHAQEEPKEPGLVKPAPGDFVVDDYI